jgi:replicative DNA helicase
MNIYINIIKTLLNKDLYNKYKSTLNYNYVKENYPETYRLLKTLDSFPEDTGTIYSVDDLELAFYTLYPNSNKDHYTPLFLQLRQCDAKESLVVEYLDKVRKRELATSIAKASLEYAEGRPESDISSITNLIEQINAGESTDGVTPESDFVTDDLETLYADRVLQKGLRWRLESLNRSLGSLRKGDFGFIFARPETGKTTFLASECTHMATQVESPIIWFNNEEDSGKVMKRCIQASLGLRLEQLHSDLKGNAEKYRAMVNGMLRIYDARSMTMQQIDKVCAKYKPSMIVFDQIDKIKGYDAERYDLQMKAIYQWARELAKTYGPVIGVCQAGGTGDGKKWLTMNDVDSSHTAKQGEADWMLGIGKTFDHGLEEVRYMHISKNKLDGDIDTDPDMRHGKFEVRIQPDVARYFDF